MTVIEAPVNHMANTEKNTQHQLSTHLQKNQAMTQAMQMQYAAEPHMHFKIMEAVGITKIIAANEDQVRNSEEIGEAAVEAVSTGIIHLTVGLI